MILTKNQRVKIGKDKNIAIVDKNIGTGAEVSGFSLGS